MWKGWPRYTLHGAGGRQHSQPKDGGGRGHFHGQTVRDEMKTRAERHICDTVPSGYSEQWLKDTEMARVGSRTKMCPKN